MHSSLALIREGAALADEALALLYPVEAVAKAEAATPDPLTSEGFDAVVLTLLRRIRRTVRGDEKTALDALLRWLDFDWVMYPAVDRAARIQKAAKEWFGLAVEAAPKVETLLRGTGPTIGGAARRAAAEHDDLNVAVHMSAVDSSVLEAAGTQTALYVRDQYGKRRDDLSRLARGIVEDGIERGYDRYAIGKELRTELAREDFKRSDAYYRMIADVFAVRARTFGILSTFRDAGITAYEISAIGDEATCDVCNFLDGKTFSVRAALDRYATVAASEDPSIVESEQPWGGVGKDADGASGIYVGRGENRTLVALITTPSSNGNKGAYQQIADDAKLQALGFTSCPFHAHCFVEGTLVDTPTGRRAIETLRVGDYVIGGITKEPRRVVALHVNPTETLIRITDTAGECLIGTAEHPLLTASGWRHMGALQIGDELVRQRRQSGVRELDRCSAPTHDCPAERAQGSVFRGVGAFFCVACVPVAGIDLDGEQTIWEREVDIVLVDCELRHGAQSGARERFGKDGLQTGELGHTRAPFSLRTQSGVPARFAAESGMRGAHENHAFCRRVSRLPHSHRLAPIPHRNSELATKTNKHVSANSHARGDCLQTQSLINIEPAKRACVDLSRARMASVFREFHTTTVASIEIVAVSETAVYNITVEGDETYVANGFVVHNCRCVLLSSGASAPPYQTQTSAPAAETPPRRARAAPPADPSVPKQVRRGGFVKNYLRVRDGLHDADLDYLRDPESYKSFKTLRAVYERSIAEGKTPTQVATEVIDPNNSREQPLKIRIGPDGFMEIGDGRHRWALAHEYGATHVRAKVQQYNKKGAIAWEAIVDVPLLDYVGKPLPQFAKPARAKIETTAAYDVDALWNRGVRLDRTDYGRENMREKTRKVFGDRLPTVEALERTWSGGDVSARVTSIGAFDTGDTSVTYSGDLVKDGTVIGSFTRTFTRKGGATYVKHDYFRIEDPKHQGGGLGEAMLRQAVHAYDQLGVKAIKVETAWVGKYTWATFGYQWSSETAAHMRINLSRFLQKHGVQRTRADSIAAASAKHPWDVATLDVDGIKTTVVVDDQTRTERLGKAFLLGGSSWNGELEIADKTSPSYLRAKERLKL